MIAPPLGICLRVVLLDLEVDYFLIFWEITIPISKGAVPACTPTSNAGVFPLTHILSSISWSIFDLDLVNFKSSSLGAGKMSQKIKVFNVKSDNPSSMSSFLELTQWKEKTKSPKLSSDLHVHTVACAHTHVHKQIMQLKKKRYQFTMNKTLRWVPTTVGPWHPCQSQPLL